MPIYASQGVEYLWLVDPVGKSLETVTLIGGNWTLTRTCKDDDKVALAPFEDAEIYLSDRWKTQAQSVSLLQFSISSQQTPKLREAPMPEPDFSYSTFPPPGLRA